MKTLMGAILNKLEIDKTDEKLSVRDAVLREYDDARVVLEKTGVFIKSGGMTIGKGVNEDLAWENAILTILDV